MGNVWTLTEIWKELGFCDLRRVFRRTRQLVESFRDETGRPRQRTVSTLGRLDEAGGQVESLLKGLLPAKGMPASMADTPQIAFESTLALGDVWALDQLWKELGFDALATCKSKL